MRRKIIIFTSLLLLASGFNRLGAADWKQLIDLKGQWLFTVGNDPDWSKVNINTNDWDMIPVPYNWEHFYEGYNGYAWYRKTFNFNALPSNQKLTLFLGYIDDVDEVFLNGEKIGQSGNFPPKFSTAFDIERQYPIDKKLLRPGENVLAIKVYDDKGNGGITAGERIGIYTDKDQMFLNLNLCGEWKFSTDNENHFQQKNFDDQSWQSVFVPASWESQGYKDYDGYGYYRKKFNLTEAYIRSENYLILGKIDDFDRVYLNGELIGKVEDLEEYNRFNKNNAYSLYRIYRIPQGLLQHDNIIAVEVLDTHGIGGIYEGPIGIMSHDRMIRFKEEHKQNTEEGPLDILYKLLFK